jgi:para-aminobenzoate synthetase component 1
VRDADAWAAVGGRLLTGCVDVTADATALDSDGQWVVVQTFEGELTCIRMSQSRPLGDWYAGQPPWAMPARSAWTSTLLRDDYVKAVTTVRERIAAGDVYQVNLCRLLNAAVPTAPDLRALGAALARCNPAPYAVVVHAPVAGVHVASASPELFLGRDGDRVRSGPIKGTGRTPSDLTDKDRAENVMIVDLVRNDLARVARAGTVDVDRLLDVEAHPGLVHLVSTVSAQLRPGIGWAELLAAAAPPGSVSGAPKQAALAAIRELEPTPRGVYCGGVGVVDAARGTGCLAVAIRTFVWSDGVLTLGTGAGITWGSDPDGEWDETELKVARLLEVR